MGIPVANLLLHNVLNPGTFGYNQGIATQAAQTRENYLAPMLRAKLAQMGATTAQSRAQVPNIQAQAAHTRESTHLAPLLAAIQQQQANTKQSAQNLAGSPINLQYKLGKGLQWLPESSKATYAAQHQPFVSQMQGAAAQQYQDAMRAQGYGQQQQQQPQQQQSIHPLIQHLLNHASAGQYGVSPQSLLNIGSPTANAPGMAAQPASQSGQPGVYDSPEQMNTAKRAAQIAANNAATTAPTRSRAEAGQQVENFLRSPSSMQSLNTLTKYSGSMGIAKGAFEDKFGKTAYANLESARKQFPTIVSGGLHYLEGLPSSTEGLEQGKNFFTLANKYWGSNPKRAYQYLQNGLNFIHDESKATLSAAQPIFPGARSAGAPIQLTKPASASSSSSRPYTQEEINLGVKNNPNYTNASLIAALRKKGINVAPGVK